MRSRSYLLSLVDSGGNVQPELSAARRLRERGHQVTVLAEDSIALDVQATAVLLLAPCTEPARSAAGA